MKTKFKIIDQQNFQTCVKKNIDYIIILPLKMRRSFLVIGFLRTFTFYETSIKLPRFL